MTHPPVDPRLIEPPSNFQTHMGFEMTGWAENYARVEMPVAEFSRNRQGIPHGGIHATLLDTAMGFACCYTGDPDRQMLVMTLSLNLQYLAAASRSRLITEATRTGGGRKTSFAEGHILDDTGTLIAKGSGVFRHRNSG